MISRRHFIAAGAAAASVVTLAPLRRLEAATPHPRPGLQLLTVMAPLERDFAGTLGQIARIGYREVETLGACGRDVRLVRELLERHGLVSPSQHLLPGDLYADVARLVRGTLRFADFQSLWEAATRIERIGPMVEEGIERARVLGQRHLVLQALWPQQMATRHLMEQFCKALNAAGELCAREGLVFGFHNHSDEFRRVDDFVPYELLIENTDPDTVKLELDAYWMSVGKADPLAYLARYPARYKQIHLKDRSASGEVAELGQGMLNVPTLIAAAKDAGVEHYYVEYDLAARPWQVARESFGYLEGMLQGRISSD